jgi:hypothetical protein
MTHKQIISFILDNKEIIYLITVLLTIIVLLIANVKYAAALQSCNAAKVEQYKNNEPKLDVGSGGFDNWQSSVIPN